MRTAMLATTVFALLLSGCGSYNQVNQGWQGPTSPNESGQHGADSDQIGIPDSSEYVIKPIEEQITNGNTDPSMEGSGNLAAQGDYKQVMAERSEASAPLAAAVKPAKAR